jgi:hypothetical protein
MEGGLWASAVGYFGVFVARLEVAPFQSGIEFLFVDFGRAGVK